MAEKAKNGGTVIGGSKADISDFERALKEITFNLNLITLENFNNIKKELVRYVVNNEK